jgi:hypothetical protein
MEMEMTSKTIAQMCNGRFVPVPTIESSTRAERIAVMCGNLDVLRQEIGYRIGSAGLD